MDGKLHIMRPSFKFIVYIKICFILLLAITYENQMINNTILKIQNTFRLRSNIPSFLVQDRKNYFYILHRHKTSLPRCADLHPRPSSRYAILVEYIGNGQGYLLSALKLGVRLNWYLQSIRHETDLILELVRDTSPLVKDVDVTSALRAGYDQVCHSRVIDGGMYNRFVVFNMTQYESILYLDSDIIPVHDISDLIANGTLELHHTDRQVMWVHERRCNWFNAGVMLVLPRSDVFYQLMHLYQMQVDSGLIQLIDSYSGISGKFDVTMLPMKNQKDQAILNYMFHPHKNKSLSMSDKYNVLLYEHTVTSEEVLQYAHLIHLIHTKPWREPWCYLRYNHGKICDLWFATPTVLSSDS